MYNTRVFLSTENAAVFPLALLDASTSAVYW